MPEAMTLTQEHLTQVETHIEKILPDILKRNPAIIITIEGILAQHFPRRDEFARLIHEMQTLRQNVDERFDKVDERFDKVEGRLDRLEKNQLGLRRDVAKLQSGQENLIKRMDGLEQWMNLKLGDLGNIRGEVSENLVAAALRYGLKEDDIHPETIRLRQPIHDPSGLVIRAGYTSEVDIVARNGHMVVFEVKTTRVKPGEVELLAMKVELFRLQNPDIEVEGILIVAVANDVLQEECDRHSIRLLI